jgi:outer membrane protein
MNRGTGFGTGVVAAGLLAAGLLAPGVAAAKADKVGYIDVPRVLEEFEGFRDGRKDLERDRKAFGEEYQRRVMALNKMAQDIQQGGGMLSEAKKKEKLADFEKKRGEFSEWQELESKKLQDREEGMIKRLEADVRKALETIGADGGFSFVVRKDLFLYVEKGAVDLTDPVLASLRRTAKESAPKKK